MLLARYDTLRSHYLWVASYIIILVIYHFCDFSISWFSSYYGESCLVPC